MQLEVESNSSLKEFGRCVKDVVDEKLIEHVGMFESTEGCTNVERLLNFSGSSIIEVLHNSPPELFSTMKIFLNRRIPDNLRPYIWSYALQLETQTVNMVGYVVGCYDAMYSLHVLVIVCGILHSCQPAVTRPPWTCSSLAVVIFLLTGGTFPSLACPRCVCTFLF